MATPRVSGMDFTVDLDLGCTLAILGAEDDGTVVNADVELTEPDGRRWSATVLTLAEVERLMSAWASSGDCQGGAFFRVPDLIILRDPERESVVRVFSELHRTGEHRSEMSTLHNL